VGENEHWQKGIAINWEGLFRKFTKLLQHKWQQNWILFSLKTLFPQKLSDVSFTYPLFTVGLLQSLNIWLLKVMFRFVNNEVTTIKSWHQTDGNACVMWPMSQPSSCSLQQEEFTFAEQPRKPKVRNAWLQQWNTGEALWWFGQQYLGTVFCWTHCYPSWWNYCKGVHKHFG
jgi:hypothetical protein